MEDIKAVDIMNYPEEVGVDDYPFQYEEFKVMALSTFKSQYPQGVPTEEEWAARRQSKFFAAHSSPEDLVKGMDEAGYDHVVISDMKMWSYYSHNMIIKEYGIEVIADAVQKGRGRIIGGAGYNPFRIEQSLADIEKAVREYGFKYVYFHPITFGLSPNDKRCWPLYAKCNELGIPVGMQVGHSAEPLPSWCAHPYEVDEIAINFPNLKINLSHTGYPWVDEWCSMIFRHPNVYGDISAYNPAHLETATVKFMAGGRGKEKVMFGTNGYGLGAMKQAFLSLELKDQVKKRILRDNAIAFLGL